VNIQDIAQLLRDELQMHIGRQETKLVLNKICQLLRLIYMDEFHWYKFMQDSLKYYVYNLF